MNTLQITNLSKTYSGGIRALDNLSLELSNGMFGLLGPNGAGKSTLMKTLAGLQLPDLGEVRFNGINVLSNPLYIKSQLGYLPQDFGVYPKISAFELLNHLAILKGVLHKHERKEQINALLEKVNLYAHKNKDVYTFSGGMKQRFGIAQALLGNPQLIIVDEPTAGLDPEERHRFNNLLSELGEQIIIILSTHLVEDVRNLCTKMGIINNGILLAQGAPDDFIDELKGKIWSSLINKDELTAYSEKYEVISSRLTAGKLNIHSYCSENPPFGFRPVNPDLEDVYFYQLLKNTRHA